MRLPVAKIFPVLAAVDPLVVRGGKERGVCVGDRFGGQKEGKIPRGEGGSDEEVGGGCCYLIADASHSCIHQF